MILKDKGDGENDFVSKDYIAEKLKMILNGGIGFHPHLDGHLDKIEQMIEEAIVNKSW